MKSLSELWQVVAQDLGDQCRVSTARDYETVTSRVKTEGESFLTITLPQFGKDLERSLELGRVAPNAWSGYRSRGGLPLFLGGFLEQVFDAKSGVLLDGANPQAIYAVRQLAGLCAKVRLECSPGRVNAAYKAYIECESHVKDVDARLGTRLLDEFWDASRHLFARVFSRVDGEVANFGLLPAHGPGRTADRLDGNAKFDLAEWTARLDGVVPSSHYLVPNVRFHQRLDRVDMREPGDERPVRVTHVPKTLKTPRIIAMEPTCMMFMQQALWRDLKIGLESDPLVGPLIGFSDQSPNRWLARKGSQTGELATLDLSEASDRVSNQLVLTMMRRHPHLSDAVQASRSTRADVPGYGIIPLAKFASMGSALCFPVEAMVFTTLVAMGIAEAENTSVRPALLKRLDGQVRVYGDDLIVPARYAVSVIAVLERYGLKVNVNKSFWTGRFRESCGGDYFAGVDVTPVKARAPLSFSLKEPSGLVSWVAFRNLAYERGLFKTCEALDRRLVKALNGYYPVVGPDSPVLGRISHEPLRAERTGPGTHSPQVKGYVPYAVRRENPLDGVGALTKFFLNTGDLPVTDREHLKYSGRPVAVTLKLRWVDQLEKADPSWLAEREWLGLV